MGALRREHAVLIANGDHVGCSIDLDACRRTHEPNARRWDYVLVIRDRERSGVGMEVHPAALSEIGAMIAKKAWALDLLARECVRLDVREWHWIIPPAGDAPSFRPGSPEARRIADAGLGFPRRGLFIEV